jgi:hypothetical protein
MLKSKRKNTSAHKRNRNTRDESDSPRGKSYCVNDDNGNDDAATIGNGRNLEKGVGYRFNRRVN